MQVAKARGWDVGASTVKIRIDEFEAAAARTLKGRFKFLRGLLQELAKVK